MFFFFLNQPILQEEIVVSSFWISSNDTLFILKNAQSTKGTKIKSNNPPCSCEWELSCAFSACESRRFHVQDPGIKCLQNRAHHCFRMRQGVWLMCPITHSRSPALVCALWVSGEGIGKEPMCTGSRPAMSGPVRPTHKTWTSHTHD